MKNKGRKHKHGLGGIWNCKGTVSHITRPIASMSSRGMAIDKFDKKKWSKRVRGYLKTSKWEQIEWND